MKVFFATTESLAVWCCISLTAAKRKIFAKNLPFPLKYPAELRVLRERERDRERERERERERKRERVNEREREREKECVCVVCERVNFHCQVQGINA